MPKTALEQWDETAANNTDMGGIDLSENVMRPPAVNNEMREHMAQVAKWLGDDTLASAATTDLGSVPGRYINITGTTTITAFGTIKAGTIKYLKFAGALTLTHNATSLILPGAANITTAAGDTAIFVSEGSGNWRCIDYQFAASRPVRVVRTQVFTASGAYTPHANMVYAIIECQGGGAAGGGVVGDAGAGRGGGGGGAGGYAKALVTKTDVGASKTVTIGGGGSGVSGANGGAGGTTSVGTLCSALGGAAGQVSNSGSGADPSAASGTSVGNILNINGGRGSPGAASSVTSVLIVGGNGAASFFGQGGAGARSGNGENATAPGSGGGGAAQTANAVNSSGGAGANGIVVITEFCSE